MYLMNISSKKNSTAKYIWSLLSFTAFFAFDLYGTNKSDNSDQQIKAAQTEEVTDLKKDDQNSDKKGEKDGISGLIEKISNTKASDLKKPFSDQPGYVEEVQEFDKVIYNIDTKKEFTIKKDLKGKVVILFFTTTWCPNCPAVFKDLDSLADKLSKSNVSGVVIIPLVIGNDTENHIRNYYKVNDVQLLDVFKPIKVDDTENIGGVPCCIVFNKNGDPVWKFVGIANYASQEFLNFITALWEE